jgi:hypothetical protein
LANLPDEIAARFSDWHKRAIDCVAGVSEEAAAWRPDTGPQSLLWQLWHVARWDDRFAWIIADRAVGLRHNVPKHEIWLRDSVAANWGWPADLQLGRGNAGTGLSREQNAALVFPGIQPVVDYARAAFHHVELAVASLDPATMGEIPARSKEKDTDSWATNALMYLEHLPEHISVMEVLRSLQGLSSLPDG